MILGTVHRVMSSARRVGAWLALAIAFYFAAAGVRAGQEPHLRPPTEAENTALTHYREIVHQVLDAFHSDDWDENVDYDVEDDVQVSNDRDVPLDIDEMMQRTYTVRPGSPLFDKDFKPAYDKLTSTHDPAEMAAISKQLKMNRYSVEVHFNKLSVGVNPPPGANPDLHVPGAALAYRVDNYKFDKGTSVVLLFGDWKATMWRPSDKDYRYKFQHAFRQPAIENVVIQLDGSPEGINEVLHAAPWKRVNEALTK